MKDRSIGFVCLALTMVSLLAGCESTEPSALALDEQPRSVVPPNPAGLGSIQGRVTWVGELPRVPPFQVRGNPLAPSTHGRRAQVPNPNAPRIDQETRGVADAFVFLEGGSDTPSSWPHPPVRVELRDRQFTVLQGARQGRVGIVRRGDVVEFCSHDSHYHSVRLRGASFLSVCLPDPDQSVKVKLERAGVVELISGAGHYWMRAYLLVSESPACAITDAHGHFTLPQVPAGEREVTCWLPNWAVARQERDPETGVATRLDFDPGLRVTKPCAIRPGATFGVDLTIGSSPEDVHAR